MLISTIQGKFCKKYENNVLVSPYNYNIEKLEKRTNNRKVFYTLIEKLIFKNN